LSVKVSSSKLHLETQQFIDQRETKHNLGDIVGQNTEINNPWNCLVCFVDLLCVPTEENRKVKHLMLFFPSPEQYLLFHYTDTQNFD